MGGIPHAATCARGGGPLDHRGQLVAGADPDPVPLGTPQMLATLEMLGMARVYTVTLMVGTNDVSRGEARKVARLHDKMSCILEELPIQTDPAILTVCTIPYNICNGDEHKSAKPERNNQADKPKKCPPRWVVGRGRANGAICFP